MSQLVTSILDTLQSSLSQPRDSGNAPVLLMLGAFKFSLNTAVFQQLDMASSYRWAAVERFGSDDALQFTGPGENTITLPGIVYPDFRGGTSQLVQLQAMAQAGKPYRLVLSDGTVSGYWVITGVRETRSQFKADGGFRKQAFDVSLRFYGNDLR